MLNDLLNAPVSSSFFNTVTSPPIAKALKKLKKPPIPQQSLHSQVLQILNEYQATDISTIDLSGKSSLADAMVIATGTSARHIETLAHYLMLSVPSVVPGYPKTEGKGDSGWIIIDLGDVIVHVFKAETRAMYNLERMWSVDFS
jgi:ribosome-associated protein